MANNQRALKALRRAQRFESRKRRRGVTLARCCNCHATHNVPSFMIYNATAPEPRCFKCGDIMFAVPKRSLQARSQERSAAGQGRPVKPGLETRGSFVSSRPALPATHARALPSAADPDRHLDADTSQGS